MNSTQRTRVICFRTTDAEYQDLRGVCAATGVRSISELARTALRRLVAPAACPTNEQLPERVRQLEAMVHALRLDVLYLEFSLERRAGQLRERRELRSWEADAGERCAMPTHG